jgi:tetratricopeptide (TPR) repeat protein
LAGVLIDSGKMDEAITVLKKELDASPEERSLTYFLLGKAYLQLHKYDKAQESYQAAVAIRPDYANAWYGLSTAHVRLGHREQAGKSMEKFRKHRKAAGESMESRTGRAAGQNPDSSEERFQRELATVRELTALTHTSVAAVYRTKGYLHWARQHWHRAAELDPKDAQSRKTLALFYLEGGQYAKALPICEQLVKIDPKNAVFHFNLGSVYAKMNQLDAALTALKRAIDLRPKASKPRRVYQEIQKRKQRERQN